MFQNEPKKILKKLYIKTVLMFFLKDLKSITNNFFKENVNKIY